MTKGKKITELGISFGAGIGLMSIFEVWKISQGLHAIEYAWIMFFASIITVFMGVIYLMYLKRKTTP